MVIYKITNTIDGKCYVGKTTGSAVKRFERHCRLSSRCPKLSAAIKKHGKENFQMEVIDQCSNEYDLNQREIYWIETLNSINAGYNLTFGGDGGLLSSEAKQKISLARSGSKASVETKQKFSAMRQGHGNSKAKKVIVIQNGIEKQFDCLKYAAEFYSVKYSTARSVAQGCNKQTRNGLVFKYVEIL